MDQSTRKNQSLRRRQTIDTAQTRQYASRRQNQTPLKQMQAKFWPARHSHHTNIINNNQSNEHEEMPMITEKQTATVQRSSSARERNQNTINDKLNERKKWHRTQRHSNTIAIV